MLKRIPLGKPRPSNPVNPGLDWCIGCVLRIASSGVIGKDHPGGLVNSGRTTQEICISQYGYAKSHVFFGFRRGSDTLLGLLDSCLLPTIAGR